MGYWDGFYVQENIIGYTGSITSNPTVYFQSGNRFGHITQDHGIKENIGRETVRQHANYGIANETIDGKESCVERIGPTRRGIIHVSRNKFIGEGDLNDAHKALLSKSITRFTAQKAIGGMIRVEVNRLLDGSPDTGVDVAQLIEFHEQRAGVAGA